MYLETYFIFCLVDSTMPNQTRLGPNHCHKIQFTIAVRHKYALSATVKKSHSIVSPKRSFDPQGSTPNLAFVCQSKPGEVFVSVLVQFFTFHEGQSVHIILLSVGLSVHFHLHMCVDVICS